MTLGCLAPYRRLGIGTKMLEHVLNVVKEDGNFTSIFLHVQINNESAIEFYKKFGFNIVETKEQYYKVRIDFSGKASSQAKLFTEDRASRRPCSGEVSQARGTQLKIIERV